MNLEEVPSSARFHFASNNPFTIAFNNIKSSFLPSVESQCKSWSENTVRPLFCQMYTPIPKYTIILLRIVKTKNN